MNKLFSINIPIDLHKQLRLLAASKDMTMTEIVVNAIKKEIEKTK